LKYNTIHFFTKKRGNFLPALWFAFLLFGFYSAASRARAAGAAAAAGAFVVYFVSYKFDHDCGHNRKDDKAYNNG